MAIIKPSDLPANATPVTTDLLVTEGATVGKSTVAQVMTAGRPFATQAEAEAGSGTTQTMNPLTTKQAIASEVGVTIQAHDDDLVTIGGLAKTDGNFIVADGAAWTAESGATARASLGLVIGTDVQAYDADLDAIAALTSAADKIPYATGSATWALADFTAAGRSIAGAADAAAQRTAMELGTAAVANLIDEDDMVSNSAVALPSQQSVKAYVDGASANVILDEDDFASDSAVLAPSQQSTKAYVDLRTTPDIRAYGAIGDGDIANAAVNAAAVVASLAAQSVAVIPQTTLGFHFGTSELEVDDGEYIMGSGQRPLVLSTATGNFISLIGTGTEYSGVANLTIDMEGCGPSSCALRFRNDRSTISLQRLRQLSFRNCYGAIRDVPEITSALTNVFTTAAGSPLVYIAAPAHGWTQAKVITISGAGTVDGLAMDGSWTMTVIDTDTIRFTHTSNASAGVTNSGSASVTYENGVVYDVIAEEIGCTYNYGTQIRVDYSQGMMVFRDVVVNNSLGSSAEPMASPFVTWDSIRFTDFVGLEMDRVHVIGQGFIPKRTCTISIASPGVVTRAGHGLEDGARMHLYTDGALPTGLSLLTDYYVVNATADTFQLSASLGGAAINTSGGQSGTHQYCIAVFHNSIRDIALIGTNRTTDFVWARTLRSEASNGHGIYMQDVTFGDTFAVEGFGSRGNPVWLVNCAKMRMTNTYGRGGTDADGANSGQDSIIVSGCDGMQFLGGGGAASKDDGMLVTNSVDCQFIGMRFETNDGQAVTESGTSDRNTYRDIVAEGNGTDTYSLTGASSRWLGGLLGTARQPQNGWACKAHRNGTNLTGILSATWTQVTFATEEYDFGGSYGTGTSRIFPQAGPARIKAQVMVTAGLVDGSPLTVALRLNGTATAVAETTVVPGAASAVSIPVEWSGVAAASDYFEVWVYLAGAGDKTISGATRYTFFEGTAM